MAADAERRARVQQLLQEFDTSIAPQVRGVQEEAMGVSWDMTSARVAARSACTRPSWGTIPLDANMRRLASASNAAMVHTAVNLSTQPARNAETAHAALNMGMVLGHIHLQGHAGCMQGGQAQTCKMALWHTA